MAHVSALGGKNQKYLIKWKTTEADKDQKKCNFRSFKKKKKK